MNPRNYALSVSLVAAIGLLVTITPVRHSLVEYRSPRVASTGDPLRSIGQRGNLLPQPPSGKFSVQLDINASPSLEHDISSFFTDDLQSLGDVEITDYGPRFSISIVAAETCSEKPEQRASVAFAVVITEPLDPAFLPTMFRRVLRDAHPGKRITKQEEAWLDLLRIETKDRDTIKAYWLRLGMVANLRKICAEIVTRFDAENLKPVRDFRKRMRNGGKHEAELKDLARSGFELHPVLNAESR